MWVVGVGRPLLDSSSGGVGGGAVSREPSSQRQPTLTVPCGSSGGVFASDGGCYGFCPCMQAVSSGRPSATSRFEDLHVWTASDIILQVCSGQS